MSTAELGPPIVPEFDRISILVDMTMMQTAQQCTGVTAEPARSLCEHEGLAYLCGAVFDGHSAMSVLIFVRHRSARLERAAECVTG